MPPARRRLVKCLNYVSTSSAPIELQLYSELPLSQVGPSPERDVVFKSSDNVLFHVESKNLERYAAIFPLENHLLPSMTTDVVPLSENSTTLELLFQFIRPDSPPDLRGINDFVMLFALAEAAEKYIVYSARTICAVRLECVSA